jgi:sec-independent protein translocase protein TatB
MFETSLPELVLVAVIGLLVLGPQRLPKVAAEIGKWVSRARRTATQLRRQLEREVELNDIQPPPPRPPPPTKPAVPPAATPPADSASSKEPAPVEPTEANPPPGSPAASSGTEPADRPPV